MNLGFVGTGEISAAMVTGLCSGSTHDLSIRLSPPEPEPAELHHPGARVGTIVPARAAHPPSFSYFSSR